MSLPAAALYIYYKVQPEQASPLLAAVQQMQSQLRRDMPGLSAQVAQRVASPQATPATASSEPGRLDTLLTWMESYSFNGHAQASTWQQFWQALQTACTHLPPGICGERHEEWFGHLPS